MESGTPDMNEVWVLDLTVEDDEDNFYHGMQSVHREKIGAFNRFLAELKGLSVDLDDEGWARMAGATADDGDVSEDWAHVSGPEVHYSIHLMPVED